MNAVQHIDRRIALVAIVAAALAMVAIVLAVSAGVPAGNHAATAIEYGLLV